MSKHQGFVDSRTNTSYRFYLYFQQILLSNLTNWVCSWGYSVVYGNLLFIILVFHWSFFCWNVLRLKEKKFSDFRESLVLILTFSHLLQTWSYLYFTGNKTPRPQRKRTDRRNAGRVFQDKDIYRNCKLLDYLCIKIFWTQKFPTIDIERIEERSNRKSECQIENEAKYIHVFRFILCCWCFGFFF